MLLNDIGIKTGKYKERHFVIYLVLPSAGIFHGLGNGWCE